ncbi:hypothetical protein F4779DRAFT_620962 [Xylariaceae sp. FL0662B]|nr:hypothetical protein F4779DRAFT_620962 [Xylariaceae sp. FL0662B]
MQFKPLTLAAAVLSVSQTYAQTQITSTTVVTNIEQVTTVSSDTNQIAGSISFLNAFTTCPELVSNFGQIVTLVQQDITSMQGINSQTTVFKDTEQLKICDAFRQFVAVHQQLLNTVIGKKSILASVSFTAPIAAVLRSIEQGVDTLAFGIIDLVPTCAETATKCKDALDGSLNQAVTEYS